MSSPELERAIRIKTNASRGGVIEHIRYEDIRVGQVQDAVVVNFYYEEGEKGGWPPTVKDVEIRRFYVEQAERAFVLRGFPKYPLDGLLMENCEIVSAGSLGIVENVNDIHLRRVVVNGSELSKSELI